MVAKTLFGFEELLAKELRNLGAQDIKIGVRNVSFAGDKGFMYKANLGLRTAIKILKPIKTFKVVSEQDLYEKVKSISWENYLKPSGSLAVDATVHSHVFTHSKYIALKTKDAVVDRFRDKAGERPNVDLRFPDLKINVHIDRQLCTVSLDSSGESLHRRGYKTATNIAPINEVLAAGLVLLSGWDGQSDFMDPMCGSGTIMIEAAMIACNIPPALHRKSFGFMGWENFDEQLWDTIKDSSMKKVKDFPGKIIACDRAFASIRKAEANVKDALLDDIIEVHRMNFIKKPYLFENKGVVLFNPPYGERLEADVNELYGQIGDTFKKNYAGCSAWLITSDMEAVKHIGLKHTRRIKLFNGQLECRFLKYEMYEGSKKKKQ